MQLEEMFLAGQRVCFTAHMAVAQNQWYHFGVGAPPILVYFSGDWDVHWGYDLDFDPWPHGSRPLLGGKVTVSSLHFPSHCRPLRWPAPASKKKTPVSAWFFSVFSSAGVFSRHP